MKVRLILRIVGALPKDWRAASGADAQWVRRKPAMTMEKLVERESVPRSGEKVSDEAFPSPKQAVGGTSHESYGGHNVLDEPDVLLEEEFVGPQKAFEERVKELQRHGWTKPKTD